MASRGSSDNGGGCLGGIIAFFILLFLPAWVTGDSFGWGVLIIWWIILAAIALLIVRINSPSNNTSDSNPQRQNLSYTSLVSAKPTYGSLKADKSQLNKSIMDGYISKLDLRVKLEKDIESIHSEQGRIDDDISEQRKKEEDINSGKDKPFLMSKKKWLTKKQADIEEIEKNIAAMVANQHDNEIRIAKLKEDINAIKFNVFDENNDAFEKLKKAFDRVKKSCNVAGTPDLKVSSISKYKRDQDLKYVQYKTEPYGLQLDNYRFYLFPNGIWIFEGEDNLVGVYKPKAIKGSFETNEIVKQSYYSMYSKKPDVYKDTKIITKDIEHHTWLHTCRDGSPDMRYSHNPRQTYYTKQEYYVECSFDLSLCGCKLKYEISSFDNCKLLEKAILAYSEVKENKDMIPILLDLLKQCSNDRDINMLQDKWQVINGGLVNGQRDSAK